MSERSELQSRYCWSNKTPTCKQVANVLITWRAISGFEFVEAVCEGHEQEYYNAMLSKGNIMIVREKYD